MKQLLKQCVVGCGTVILASFLASVLLAPVFELINTYRSYGLPGELASVAQASIYSKAGSNIIPAVIDWYNSSLGGYARFGSGIGMIGGAFWALGTAKNYGALARVFTGLLAGFLMSARMMMMITSDTYPVMTAGTLGGLCTGLYLYIVGRASKFKPLPRLHLSHSDDH